VPDKHTCLFKRLFRLFPDARDLGAANPDYRRVLHTGAFLSSGGFFNIPNTIRVALRTISTALMSSRNGKE
jgi:hypothetical protein